MITKSVKFWNGKNVAVGQIELISVKSFVWECPVCCITNRDDSESKNLYYCGSCCRNFEVIK